MRLAGRGAIVALAFAGIVFAPDSFVAQEKPSSKITVCANPPKDLVLLTVTVANKRGRLIENLSRSDFTVTSNDQTQKIDYFCARPRSLSVGILLDISASMHPLNNSRLPDYTKEHIIRLIEQLPPRSEYFVLAFGDYLELIDWTRDPQVIKRRLGEIKSLKGSTPLYDAISTGMAQFTQRADRKKVLIMVTDGVDNNSKHGFEETLKALKGSDLLVFGIDYVDPIAAAIGMSSEFGQRILKQFSSTTGGTAFFLRRPRELADAFDAVSSELRTGYLLGFHPNDTISGKWRHITVKVRTTAVRDPDKPGQPPTPMELTARTREGYYAK